MQEATELAAGVPSAAFLAQLKLGWTASTNNTNNRVVMQKL